MTPWVPAYVGLGSNLASPARQVASALDALGRLADTRLVLASALYESDPVGIADQPRFVNAAAGLLTRLAARELLDALHGLERAAGRERSAEPRWGPRTLDLDLLVYSNRVIDDDGLTVPHPRMRERNFVLLPLAEFAPSLRVPGLGLVERLQAAAGTAGIRRLGPAGG